MRKVIQTVSILLCTLGCEGRADPCKLPAEKISLSILDQTKFYSTENRETSTRIYLGLCHVLDKLDENISKICDKNAFACVTKFDNDGNEVEFIRNAGTDIGEGLKATSNNVGLKYSDGESCVNGSNQTVSYSTDIDFICQQEKDGSSTESITYIGTVDNCINQVYWFTSLACLPAQRQAVETGSCVLEIPGPDIKVDLLAWAAHTFYTANSELAGQQRSFQLNLCRPASTSLCGNESLVCEVDDNWETAKQNIIEKDPVKLASYDALREMIVLKYDSGTARVTIEIECDAGEEKPRVSLVHNNGSDYTFSMKTAKACFVPAVHCHAESQSGKIFNFENLLATEWDFTRRTSDNRTYKYQIKVCGSLPIFVNQPSVTTLYPCDGQTGICYFEESDLAVSKPVRLGVMSRPPRVNMDGSISMVYEGGDWVADHNCSRSAEIFFRCDATEKGPQYGSSDDLCRHVIHWNTPEACQATTTKATSDCTIREPLYSHLFNLTGLHRDDSDYQLSHDGKTFVINPCGTLHQDNCKDPGTICLSKQLDITYDDGLKLHLESEESKCREGGKVGAVVEVLCHHSGGVGQPQIYTLEEGCRYKVEWLTALACPPHDVVQCSVETDQAHQIDLSDLSLPHENYQVMDGEGKEYIINICRSIVHTEKSHCPYKSAACSTVISDGQVKVTNLGQVVGGLQYSHADQQAFIRYKLGSSCRDSASNKTHLETVIRFKCQPDLFDSRPEFVEFENCRYELEWRHAAACPVRRVESANCSITHPDTGFTYDLNSLQKTRGYKWTGSYHHLQGSFDFNICGAVNSTKCGAGQGGGICGNGSILGKANRELFIEDGQMFLNYTDGKQCEGGQRMFTIINLLCPYDRVNSPSGNYESEHQRYQVQRVTKCKTVINFPTELACDHQVNCQLSSGGSVFSLDKLRRHQDNYHVPNTDPARSEFVLNICGPLVAADVASPECNPHSVCTKEKGEYRGLGKAVTSPTTLDDGQIAIDYRGGDTCNRRGDQPQSWRSMVVFTCDKTAASAQHPFGFPRHNNTDTDLCIHTFNFPTVLVCPEVYETKTVAEPDSCKIYHSGIEQYIDISALQRPEPYILNNTQREKFEIQPCGKNAPSCSGAICHVTSTNRDSLGHLADFTYQPQLDAIRVSYKEGDQCNIITNKKWTSKIYYTCDRRAGLGRPTIQDTYDCVVIFNWRTSLVCTGNTKTVVTPPPQRSTSILPETSDEESPVSGGSSGSSWVFLLVCLLVVAFLIVLYVKPSAREKVFRVVQGSRARLPVWLGGRSREDTTLLVSDGRMTASGFGALSDEHDFS